MSLDEADQGEISLPSESSAISFEGNLRQFIILTRRAFNEPALLEAASAEGIKVAQHSNSDNAPYFGLTIGITPTNESIEDFVENSGDDFFASILRITSFSTQRGVSGKRAVFVREFRRDDPFAPETVYTKILVSTSVFFNDYRVTTGFPADQYELGYNVQSIVNRLEQEWGDRLDIDITGVLEPYEETAKTIIQKTASWPFPTSNSN
jgi:hypothetical protein